MAGELVQVLGKSAWFNYGSCPKERRGQKYKLMSTDGESFEVEAEGLCLARRLFQQAIGPSGSEPIEVSFRKTTVGKVVEYLNWHKGSPPTEIRTPLESDNLVECGASKWDASFINVDKDLLFDLLAAALSLDIPSLAFLAAARAALLIKGKAPDKLMKDFKVSNDLPEEEEEQLNELFTAQLEKDNATPDESGLSGVALLINALVQAADRNGIFAASKLEEPAAPKADLKSFRHAAWRAMVLSDWTQLSNAPFEVQNDRDLLFATLSASRGETLKGAPEELRADKTIVLEALKHNGELMKEASLVLRRDKEFMAEAVAISGSAFVGASEELQDDKEFLLAAAQKKQGSVFRGAKSYLKTDKGFVLQMAIKDPQAFKYVPDEVRNNRDFVLQAVSLNGAILQYVPFHLQADRDVVKAAISNDPNAVAFAHTAARTDLGANVAHDSEPGMRKLKKDQDRAGLGSKTGPISQSRIAGEPLTKEEAKADGIVFVHTKAQKIVQFSALSTMTANMGQSNYIAANSFLDKMPFYERPETDAVTLMWGAVGNIGMRWKAFASADMLNANPEALMGIPEASKVLTMTATRMDPPEWYAASYFDEWTRQSMLAPTAGMFSGGGYRSGENVAVPVVKAGPEEEKRQKVVVRTAEVGPLGGWPSLSDYALPVPELPDALKVADITAGMHVQLCNLQETKNGMTGVAERLCKDGKWKVRLDKGGCALLTPFYLVEAR